MPPFGWLFDSRINPVSCLRNSSPARLDINEINDLEMKNRFS
jgi:hypothetical protein